MEKKQKKPGRKLTENEQKQLTKEVQKRLRPIFRMTEKMLDLSPRPSARF